MTSSDRKSIHPIVSAALAATFSTCTFFIVFSLFDVNERMSYADFDAGSVGIAASSFFATSLSLLIFQKKRRLIFYAASSILILLVFLLYFYVIRETIRLGEYSLEFNWLFISFIPCGIVFCKGLRGKWFRFPDEKR